MQVPIVWLHTLFQVLNIVAKKNYHIWNVHPIIHLSEKYENIARQRFRKKKHLVFTFYKKKKKMALLTNIVSG